MKINSTLISVVGLIQFPASQRWPIKTAAFPGIPSAHVPSHRRQRTKSAINKPAECVKAVEQKTRDRRRHRINYWWNRIMATPTAAREISQSGAPAQD